MNWKASHFAPGAFAHAKKPPPAQTGKMTQKKLTALIRAGYGQGHFHRYKPWLRVTKRDYSPNSNVGHLPGVNLARQHHYRAHAERNSIQVAKWLGAVDVREAFPVWPWPHPHPGIGLPGFEGSPRLAGLLNIAKKAGILHGNFPGTRIPYVATIDELTTWQDAEGNYFLVALENKSEEVTYQETLISRAKERLELTRRYCSEAGIQHRIIHAENLPAELVVNLDLLEPRLTNQQQHRVVESAIYRSVVEALTTHGLQYSPNELLDEIGREQNASDAELTTALHLALWRQDVDHDLRHPLRPWEPLIQGGQTFKDALFQAWAKGKA